MFQGMYLQERMLQESNSMPLYGSSELNRFDPFHPYNYVRATDAPYSTFMIGRGGMQSITHFLNFAAQEKNLKDKKNCLYHFATMVHRKRHGRASFLAQLFHVTCL